MHLHFMQGISADDAAFLPAVETALSLVQDAGALVGERIAVYGQGIIG
jgi:threonine dehydrogenase-like Zn-dependent dehydrogenase